MNNKPDQFILLLAEGLLILFFLCNPNNPEMNEKARNIFSLFVLTTRLIEYVVVTVNQQDDLENRLQTQQVERIKPLDPEDD